MDVEDVVERLQADPRHGNLDPPREGMVTHDLGSHHPKKRRAPDFFP